MKTTNHIAKWIQAYFMLLFCISTVIFTACNEDKLNLDQEIYGLGGNDEQKNELDKWLYENYTQAYNIEVKYKWNSYEHYRPTSPHYGTLRKTFYGYDSTSLV